MPPALVTNELVQQAVSTMDEAFKQGDSNMFEVALIALLDECADLVNRGDYQQWW
jgi:hypothetical protein